MYLQFRKCIYNVSTSNNCCSSNSCHTYCWRTKGALTNTPRIMFWKKMQHLHSQNDEKIKNLHETFREKENTLQFDLNNLVADNAYSY